MMCDRDRNSTWGGGGGGRRLSTTGEKLTRWDDQI